MAADQKINCIIVDDNAFIREVLSDLLQEHHPDVEIMATAGNGSEAIHHLERLQPDLVFLDVEMPDMTGFDVLARIDAPRFQTIFVTSHSHYAIQAIRFNALDYLVKPVEPKELATALRRFRSKAHADFQQGQVELALDNLEKDNEQDKVLYLPTQEGGLRMVLREIVQIESDRNYSTIHLCSGQSKLSAKTLGHFEEILAGESFFRCHRSYLLNRLHIDELQKDEFVMKNGQRIPISRRRKTDAKHWFYNTSSAHSKPSQSQSGSSSPM